MAAESIQQPSTSRNTEETFISESSNTSSESERDYEDVYNTQRNVLSRDEKTSSIIEHETIWELGQVRIDLYKDIKLKSKLNVGDVAAMNELDFWLTMFPGENIDFFLEATNSDLMREVTKTCSKTDFFKVIGLIYAMSTFVLPNRRDYWSTKENNSLFPPPAFGVRFGMGYHRFERILQAFCFVPEDTADTDKWKRIRPFVNMLQTKWNDTFSPDYKVCIDESMFSWYGRGNHHPEGLPAVIKITRKLKGVGCECKTLADVQTNIMIRLEIN